MTSTPRHLVLGYALAALFSLSACFLVHRLMSFTILATNYELSATQNIQAFLVGAMSDVWIAALGSAFVLLAGSPGLLKSHRNVPKIIYVFTLLIVSILTAGHQAYVEFYHAPMALFHLRYLFDSAFLQANSASFLSPLPLTMLGIALVLAFSFTRIRCFFNSSAITLSISWVLLVGIAAILHSCNLHYRVQWFVPEKLQSNAFERLTIEAARGKTPSRLSQQDLQELGDGSSNEKTNTVYLNQLWNIATVPQPSNETVHPVAKEIKWTFSHALEEKRKPLLLIVLMESLRPAEVGFFSPTRPSLTPNLDKFAAQGIAFLNAFSTGVVTRGAQEAAFCGYLGSRDTSLMRGSVTFTMPCLPKLLQHSRLKGDFFWLHGGEGRFDSQLDFWRGQGIGDILSLRDFSSSAPRTGWGVGDISLVQEAQSRIIKHHQATQADYLLGMILTVSNHIPWHLPEDASELKRFEHYDHPSYLTTQYSDEAFGRLVKKLKESGIWQDTLMIVAGDHGNTVPPYLPIYHDQDPKILTAMLKSHIYLSLGGGLVDKALQRQNLEHLSIATTTSQAGIASFLAYLIDDQGHRFMADSLLAASPKLAVLSDIEDGLFNPSTKKTYPYTEVLRSDLHQYDATDRKAALRYRAFLSLISERKPQELRGE